MKKNNGTNEVNLGETLDKNFINEANLEQLYTLISAFYPEIDPKRTKIFLEDVQLLHGKLPNGRFEGRPSDRDLEIIAGLEEKNLDLYKEELGFFVQRGIHYLGTIRRYKKPNYNTILSEIRKNAIYQTLEKLLPNFQMERKDSRFSRKVFFNPSA